MNTFQLADLFTDYAVLQRNQEIAIWGTGKNNSTIIVTIGKIQKKVLVSNGKWKLIFQPMEAMNQVTMKIESDCKTDQAILFEHIAIGEVWLSSGQSNMWFPLKYDEDYRKQTDGLREDYLIRFYDTPRISYEGQKYYTDDSGLRGWRSIKKDVQENLSAVALYYAMKLKEALCVPIGIIECNWGGSTASTWIQEQYLTGRLEVYKEEYEKNRLDQEINSYNQKVEEAVKWGQTKQHKILFDKLLFGIQSEEEQREVEELKSKEIGLPLGSKHPYRPGGLYHTMLKHIIPYSIQGVIWYQGESDSHHPELYKELFTALVHCWRTLWNRQIPFLTVQLSSFSQWCGLTGDKFPIIRELQEQASKELEQVYMICSMDVGMEYDIHPKRKKTIGERLAGIARNKIYGETILCESPEVSKIEWESNKIEVSFHSVGTGLYTNSEHIDGFEVFSQKEHITIERICVLEDKIVLYLSEEVKKGEGYLMIQYAWKPYLSIDIYNSADLPIKPFKKRIDLY